MTGGSDFTLDVRSWSESSLQKHSREMQAEHTWQRHRAAQHTLHARQSGRTRQPVVFHLVGINRLQASTKQARKPVGGICQCAGGYPPRQGVCRPARRLQVRSTATSEQPQKRTHICVVAALQGLIVEVPGGKGRVVYALLVMSLRCGNHSIHWCRQGQWQRRRRRRRQQQQQQSSSSR